jgi:lactate permease
MCSWRQTLAVWPALVVSGGSFAIFQYAFTTMHDWFPGVVLYPMTDIGGGIFSLVVTAIFLRFWRPRNEWHYNTPPRPADGTGTSPDCGPPMLDPPPVSNDAPLTPWSIARAWMPFVLMSVFLLASGILRQEENRRNDAKEPMPEVFAGIKTRYDIPIPGLHGEVIRAERLRKKIVEKDGTERLENKPEGAVFAFAWVTSPGTAVLVAAFASMLFLRMSLGQIGRVFRRTLWQMRIPIPTIAVMLGLSYVTRYAGIDATLGVAFAGTGVLYPFFAAILGWLGVFLTGTDAGSNALFGSLQKITATEVYNTHAAGAFSNLTLEQSQLLISTANSTGGVMGKMIDAQSICVATAGTNQIGREADIFKAVVWHSIFLASVVGLMTLVQAYVYPFTLMVPR